MAGALVPVGKQRATRHRKARFTISSALFEELGERLVSKPEIALAELIKNSYDADASDCRLTLSEEAIVVADDGHGMTEQAFLQNWMVVSSQNKGKQRFSPRFGRSMAGSKGIGRFSARYLGSVVVLTSVARTAAGELNRLTATFDWNRIARARDVGAVEIDYEIEPVARNTATGTTLRIGKLRDEAKRISRWKVKSDILRLTNPAAGLEPPPFRWNTEAPTPEEVDPGFAVTFSDGDEEADESGVTPSVASEILAAFVGRVRLRVNQRGRVTYKVFWQGSDQPLAKGDFQVDEIVGGYTAENLEVDQGAPTDSRGLPKKLVGVAHLPVAMRLHSPVFIDVRFFPKRKGTFSGLPVNGKTAQGWLSSNASLAVVDNHFVMPAYAERDSDWLGVDASKARNERSWQSIFTPALYPMGAAAKADPALNPMLALPRGTQLIGRVHISTHKRPPDDEASDAWLQPNMDRESLRGNGAFRLLWHLSRFAVELLAHFDRKQRLKEEAREDRRRQREVRTSLSAAIAQIRTSTAILPDYRRRLVSQLLEAETQLAESAQYAADARVSLELMSMMGVMAGFMTHEFEKALETLQLAAKSIRALASISPKLAGDAERVLKSERDLANYLSYMRAFVGKARDARAEPFKAKAQISFVLQTLHSLTEAHGIAIEVEIDPRLPGPHVPVAAYNGIVLNLVSNAMKALVAKVSTDARRIRLYAVNDGSRHTLVCSDNGIGIPDYLRSRIWDPLFTTTADEDNPLGSGLGLGLSVVQRVVSNLGGRIELQENAPPDFSTAFRVQLPLAPG
jgi:signal transduction histidine kinase